MDTGSNISTDSLLLARGFGGNGAFGGYNYGVGGEFANFSSNAVRSDRNVGTTRDMAHSIHGQIGSATDCLNGHISSGIDRISDQNEENRRYAQNTSIIDRQVNGEFRLGDKIEDGKDFAVHAEMRISDKFIANRDQMTNFEMRSIDRLRDIEREAVANARIAASCCCDVQKAIAAAAAEQARCCCDTQRLIIEKAAATDALILAVEGRSNLDKLAEARNEIAYLRSSVVTTTAK